MLLAWCDVKNTGSIVHAKEQDYEVSKHLKRKIELHHEW